MTWLDRYLQRWRIRVAIRHIPRGARLLDIGTHDGSLFEAIGGTGIGIDPELPANRTPLSGVALVKGYFPADLPEIEERFQCAAALAVVEHIPDDELRFWADSLAELLEPGGSVVITVPSPAVDKILHVLMALKLIAGIEAHQHHGFRPEDLNDIFSGEQWHRTEHRRFQMGLNNLFVFERVQT